MIDYDLIEVVLDLFFDQEILITVRVVKLFEDERSDDWKSLAYEHAQEWFGLEMPLVFSTTHEKDDQGHLIGLITRVAPIAPSVYRFPP